MNGSFEFAPAVIAALVALVTALMTTAAATAQYRDMHRAQFQAERAVRRLLRHPRWRLRSFDKIRARIGGFTEDELRQILVRSGAVRFRFGEAGGEYPLSNVSSSLPSATPDMEFWGLYSRNKDLFHGSGAAGKVDARIRNSYSEDAGLVS